MASPKALQESRVRSLAQLLDFVACSTPEGAERREAQAYLSAGALRVFHLAAHVPRDPA